MDRIEVKEIKVQEITHYFTCDKCNANLGQSIECDDGYYENLNEYEAEFNIKGLEIYKLKLNLCDKCKDEFNKEIEKSLLKLGFSKKD